MKRIALTQGQVALVDDEDYGRLNQFKWYAKQDGHSIYAMRQVFLAKNVQRTELMHRLILGLQAGDKRQCDHRDCNGLNNQISNLRVCTGSQNRQSSRKRSGCTSKYKGVCWRRSRRKWQSQVQVNKKNIYLGLFDSETDAAKSYDFAALNNHGEFALTNEMLGLFC